MQGQANVFYRYFPEKIASVTERYQKETHRLYGVLDKQLTNNEYLAGDFSIADIAHWSWARIYNWAGISIDEYPHLQRWIDSLAARPACAKGVEIPHPTQYHEPDKVQDDTVEQTQSLFK